MRYVLVVWVILVVAGYLKFTLVADRYKVCRGLGHGGLYCTVQEISR